MKLLDHDDHASDQFYDFYDYLRIRYFYYQCLKKESIKEESIKKELAKELNYVWIEHKKQLETISELLTERGS